MTLLRLATLAVAATLPIVAVRAADAPPRQEAAAAEAPAAAPSPLKKAIERFEVEVHGDLYLTAVADARQDWSRDVSLGRARIEVQGRTGALRTLIEADVADQNPLKDAYARLDGRSLRLVAGQFKAPFLERETLSAWRLPTVERGLVVDYLVSRNGLGGRRIGAVGAVRPRDGAMELSAGVFQGTAANDARLPQDYVARVAVRPVRWLTAGGSGYLAGRSRDTPGAPPRRAADAFVSVDAQRLSASAEALAGQIEQGAFRAGLALVQYGFPLGPAVHLAPLVGAETLRLSGGATGSGVVVGAVLSYGRDLKLKLQGERARRPGDPAQANAIAVELATRF